jgi:F-type H+-transporting ATPase subunit delta
MTSGTIARRYATAIFMLARDAGALERIARDLRGILAAIEANPEVLHFFVSPIVNRAEKAALLERSFDERVDRIALNALLLLVRKRRERLLTQIVAAYEKLVLAERNREPLDVISARPLAPGELQQMVARLANVYGKQFEVSTSVDATLLGGVRLAMGDRYVDGSISGRLEELARDLFAKQ